MEKRPKRSPILEALAVTTTIGVELAVMSVAGFYAGRWLDQRLHTDPWLTAAGVLLGVAAGIWGVVQTLKRFFS